VLFSYGLVSRNLTAVDPGIGNEPTMRGSQQQTKAIQRGTLGSQANLGSNGRPLRLLSKSLVQRNLCEMNYCSALLRSDAHLPSERSVIALRSPSCVSEVAISRRSRERNNVPDVLHARPVHDHALEPKSEAGMWNRTVAARV